LRPLLYLQNTATKQEQEVSIRSPLLLYIYIQESNKTRKRILNSIAANTVILRLISFRILLRPYYIQDSNKTIKRSINLVSVPIVSRRQQENKRTNSQFDSCYYCISLCISFPVLSRPLLYPRLQQNKKRIRHSIAAPIISYRQQENKKRSFTLLKIFSTNSQWRLTSLPTTTPPACQQRSPNPWSPG
jgi:hypothetical protein